MSFTETRLSLGYDFGAVGGPQFQTTTIIDGSGKEQRIINWNTPLGSWQLGDRNLTRTELDYFLTFHKSRKGSYQGFRFKDWSDYKIDQVIGTGNGSQTQFSLFKTYTVGAYSVRRRISKPVNGLKVFLDEVEQTSGFSVSLSTGIITFSTPPSTGVEVSVTGDFDVPVRFEQDEIAFRFLATAEEDAIFSLEKLSVKEIRLEEESPLELDSIPSELNLTLELGYDLGTVGGPQFSTGIVANGGGFESRTTNWIRPKSEWKVGDRTLTRSELAYFIAFFRIARGSGLAFKFKDWQTENLIPARFSQDKLDVQFLADDASLGESIFYLPGLAIAQSSFYLPTKIFEETASFSIAGDDGSEAFPFLLSGPSSLNSYSPEQIKAYIVSATWSSPLSLGLFSRATSSGTFSGNTLIGKDSQFNGVLVDPSGNFTGSIRWEVWSD
jgi:uncharacterized protein (TIGR02217 family)